MINIWFEVSNLRMISRDNTGRLKESHNRCNLQTAASASPISINPQPVAQDRSRSMNNPHPTHHLPHQIDVRDWTSDVGLTYSG